MSTNQHPSLFSRLFDLFSPRGKRYGARDALQAAANNDDPAKLSEEPSAGEVRQKIRDDRGRAREAND